MSDMSAVLSPKPETLTNRAARISTIEFWRFVFTLLVSWYHLEFTAGMGQTVFTSGSSAVEFFFILAGFTMSMSAYKRYAVRGKPMTTRESCASAVDFVKKKMISLYPVLIVVFLFWLFFIHVPTSSSGGYGGFGGGYGGGFGGGFGGGYGGGFGGAPAVAKSTFELRLDKLMGSEWEFLFLVGTPFGANIYTAPNITLWFLTALIVIGYIYTFFINKYPDAVRFAAPVCGLLFYVYFALCVVQASYVFNTLEFMSKMGFMTAGMIKAIAEMSIGVSMYFLYEHLKKKDFTIFWKVLLSLLEIYAIYRFFALTIKQPIGYENIKRVLYIAIIIMLSFLNVSLFARVMNRKFWNKLGHISFAMYVSHYFLVRPYVNMIDWLRAKSGFGSALYNFMRGMGGGSSSFGSFGGASNPMSVKDMVAFALFIIIFSVLVMLFIYLFGEYVYKPIKIIYRASLKKPVPESALPPGSTGSGAVFGRQRPPDDNS